MRDAVQELLCIKYLTYTGGMEMVSKSMITSSSGAVDIGNGYSYSRQDGKIFISRHAQAVATIYEKSLTPKGVEFFVKGFSLVMDEAVLHHSTATSRPIG